MGDLNHQRRREYVLDAAALLVQENGADTLTFDAIAAAADVSEHDLRALFETIESLVAAMTERMYSAFLDQVSHEYGDGEGASTWLEAYVRASFPQDQENFARIARALLQTTPFRLEYLNVMRETQPDFEAFARENSQDVVDATIVRLAVDGLWMSQMFGIDSLSDETRRAVIDRLIEHAGRRASR